MLSCSIWLSAPSFWMCGGLESRCVGRVYGADGAVHHPHRTHDPRFTNVTPHTYVCFTIILDIDRCLNSTFRKLGLSSS